MKILCMGQIRYDYSLPIDGFPIEGLKYDLKEKTENSGGGACNAAHLLAKWNEEVYLSAAVGGDELGTRIRKNIESAGIKSNAIETVFESKTPISFILINKNNGNKTIFSINEKEPHVKKYEFDFMPDIILLDGYEYTSGIGVVNKFPNAITILDAGEYTKSNVELCRYAKYIIASQQFAEGFIGIKADFNNPTTLLEMYKKIATKYVNSIVVITLKDHGAIYLDNNQIKVMPGLKVEKIVDSTGAGDIFHAAFAAGISRGYDIEKNIRIANIAAGLSLSKIGAIDSIPLFSDVASYYETKFGPIDGQTAPVADANAQQQVQTNQQVPQNVQSQPVQQEQPQENVQNEQINQTPVAPAQENNENVEQVKVESDQQSENNENGTE